MSLNRNIIVALLCAALIVFAVSLPYVPVIRGIVHQHISGFFANPSTPVNQSVFASLVNDTPDSVVYPQTYQVLDDPYFMIVGDYENEINVSMEEAVNASMQFLTRYLPTNLTTGLRVAEASDIRINTRVRICKCTERQSHESYPKLGFFRPHYDCFKC